MSRTITKFLFAVALLFGLLNTALAADYTGKYKATMKFGGVASGESNDVEASVIYSKDGTYTIRFSGFDVQIQMLGDINNGSASVSELNGTESNNGLTLKESSNSIFEIAKETLTITKFDATIDAEGNGSGSFSASKSLGFMSLAASCDFTLKKVVDADTVVTKELEFDNVPFYNKAVDLTKGNDTTKTNNDSSAVGIRLFQEKASFTMTDYEIAVAGLSLKQRMVLENLKYAIDDSSDDIIISGETMMYVEEYKMDMPAKANITVSPDGNISGTIVITVEIQMISLNYEITVVFGKDAEGVVIEKKDLEYTKTDSFKIKSDSAFVYDSKIYINEEGILIENIHYSVVDQPMTLLIKDYVTAIEDGKGPGIAPWIYTKNHTAKKAEAYITVKGQVSYFKDVDIKLNIFEINTYNINTVIGEPTKFVYGSLTIEDAGSNTNLFIDPEGPFMLEDEFPHISMAMDTTGNGLHEYTIDSEIKVNGIYDLVDSYIKTVKLPENDFDEIIKTVTNAAKNGAKSCDIPVIATDKAGNSSRMLIQCWPSVAPVYIEEETPKLSSYRVVADSLTGKATIKLEPLTIKYIAKNDSIGKTAIANQVVAEATIDGEKVEYMTPFELPVGKYEIKYVWSDPYKTGYQAEREATATITVYESMASYTGVSNVANKAVSVFYKDGNLVVNGANDADVKVISISGATVYTGKAGAINLHKGIYIVKVEGKAYKIIVK
ncbi:MAG: DUF6383 domain-containing protein [Paludibacteraceae bacterium]|nr:DUF6383 domain-containing protein [Paludibacteraceae bacterium]